jgi:hypothetical protein
MSALTETLVVPLVAPYRVALAEVPRAGSVSVPGYSAVGGFAPPEGSFRVHAAPPEVEFHASAAGAEVEVSYLGEGAYVPPDPPPDPAVARAERMRVRIASSGVVLALGVHRVEAGVHAGRVMQIRTNGDVVTYCGGLRPSCTAYLLALTANGPAPTVEDFSAYAVNDVPSGFTAQDATPVTARCYFDVQTTSGRKHLRLWLQNSGSGGGGGAANNVVRWTGGGSSTSGQTQDVLVILRPTRVESVAVRFRNTGGSNWSGQAWQAYNFNPTPRQDHLANMTADATSSAHTGTVIARTWPVTDWTCLRLQAYATDSLRTKLWTEGAAPPAAWERDFNYPGATDYYGGVALHHQGTASGNSSADFASLSVFDHAPDTALTVTGVPAGFSVRVDGGDPVEESGGSCVATVAEPHYASALVELLDGSDEVVASLAGTFWGGASLEVQPYDTALQEGQGRAWLGGNGLRTDTFTPSHSFAP